MPWQINQGKVRLLTFDANTYQLLSNSSTGPGKDFDFGTSLSFIDSAHPTDSACAHVFMINQLPHGAGDGNGQAEIMAYRLTDTGIGEAIWPSRQLLVKFTGYSPPGSASYVNSRGQLTVFFNQPTKYEGTDKTKDNANYIGFQLI